MEGGVLGFKVLAFLRAPGAFTGLFRVAEFRVRVGMRKDLGF